MWSGVLARERPGVTPLEPIRQQPQSWAPDLTDSERKRCEDVAWDAVTAPEIWSRYFEFPESAAGLTGLTKSGIRCTLSPDDAGRVHVAIPSGATIGWHPVYIGVTLARGSHEVLNLYESSWP